MRHPQILVVLALLSGSLSSSPAANTAAVPIANISYAVTVNATRSFGVPVVDVSKFTGFATSVAATTITVSGVTCAANQFVTTPHFVAIRTGRQAGRTLLVTANTTNTLTVA